MDKQLIERIDAKRGEGAVAKVLGGNGWGHVVWMNDMPPDGTPLFLSPPPVAPCPNCLGQEPDDLRLRDEYIKAVREIERLQTKLTIIEEYKKG